MSAGGGSSGGGGGFGTGHGGEGSRPYSGTVTSAPRPSRGSSPAVGLEIERLVAGGDALAHLADGRVVFVPGALPGERVEAEVVQAKRDFARARLVRVVEPSAHRVAPPCPALARGCGGCDWQHIEPAAQWGWKVDVVRDALRRTARLPDAAVHPGAAVPPWAYRTTMRFAVDADGRLALRRQRSNDTVTIDDCAVAHPALVAMMGVVRIEAADEVSLRVGVASGQASAWWQPSTARVRSMPAHVACGPDATVAETVQGVSLQVSAASFFQSGPDAASLLVDAVRAAAPELASAERVVDAYGGVGLFAATVVPETAEVTVVEGSPSACADARRNLADRRATVVETAVERWAPVAADVVIADPARTGLGAEAAAVVAGCGAPVMVLVSCDPVSLARDTALLADLGYRHTGTTVLDLFPHTHHVETVTRFEVHH